MEENTIKEYSKELRVLIDKSHDSFEKQLNYISAGALGLSMIVVEKIVKDLNKTACNSLLIISWCFLGATLISNMISHVFTSRLHSKTIQEIDLDSYSQTNATSRNKIINNWNFVSIGLLLLGILLQMIFITINIKL